MARRITIVFDENLTDEEYADRGNGIWAVLKIAHPDGGFHLESDSAGAARRPGSPRARRPATRAGRPADVPPRLGMSSDHRPVTGSSAASARRKSSRPGTNARSRGLPGRNLRLRANRRSRSSVPVVTASPSLPGVTWAAYRPGRRRHQPLPAPPGNATPVSAASRSISSS